VSWRRLALERRRGAGLGVVRRPPPGVEGVQVVNATVHHRLFDVRRHVVPYGCRIHRVALLCGPGGCQGGRCRFLSILRLGRFLHLSVGAAGRRLGGAFRSLSEGPGSSIREPGPFVLGWVGLGLSIEELYFQVFDSVLEVGDFGRVVV